MMKEATHRSHKVSTARWQRTARRLTTRAGDWKAFWEQTMKETIADDAIEFDDELVTLVDDCAHRVALN